VITPQNFNILVSNVEVLIQAAYENTVPEAYNIFCQETPSASDQVIYPWIGKMPKMRLWNGARVVYQPAMGTYALKNQTFENTMGIDRFSLDDDQYGVLAQMLPMQAIELKRQPDYMFVDLLEATGDQSSTTLQNGLDGTPGFGTAHPVDIYNTSQSSAIGTTYANDFTGGGYAATIGGSSVTVGGALNVSNLWTAIEYMMLYPGENGQVLGITPNEMMVPTLLMGEAEMILTAAFMSPPAWASITGQVGAAENVTKKFGIKLTVNRFLTKPKVWYLADTSRGFRPFIHQVREATRVVPRTQETDPGVFDSHTFQWGAWDRQAVGWGPAWLYARSGP
jgi:phage major head subunit gpT-like protein